MKDAPVTTSASLPTRSCWRISTNRHPGLLEIDSRDGKDHAYITYDSHGIPQNAEGLSLNAATGAIAFTVGPQKYTATVQGGKITGVVHYDGKVFPLTGEKFQVDRFPVKQVWRINANGYAGLLHVEHEAAHVRATGRLTFDALGTPEDLVNVCYGTSNSLMHFKRPRGNQIFDGTVVHGKAAGHFISDGRPFNWSADRIDNGGQALSKTWVIRVNPDYKAFLEVSAQAGHGCEGRITFEKIGTSEPLQDVHYNPSTGRLFFKRSKQLFEASTVNGMLKGVFTHHGKQYVFEEIPSIDQDAVAAAAAAAASSSTLAPSPMSQQQQQQPHQQHQQQLSMPVIKTVAPTTKTIMSVNHQNSAAPGH